jgi:hypothetical protein
MNVGNCTLVIISLATCAVLLTSPVFDLAFGQNRGRGQPAQGKDRGPLPSGRGQSAAQGIVNRLVPRAYQEPAFARGYRDGHQLGLADGRTRELYDPASNAEYRNGDEGYTPSYGSREAYKNNYRAGFRQGYEDGYRSVTR